MPCSCPAAPARRQRPYDSPPCLATHADPGRSFANRPPEPVSPAASLTARAGNRSRQSVPKRRDARGDFCNRSTSAPHGAAAPGRRLPARSRGVRRSRAAQHHRNAAADQRRGAHPHLHRHQGTHPPTPPSHNHDALTYSTDGSEVRGERVGLRAAAPHLCLVPGEAL